MGEPIVGCTVSFESEKQDRSPSPRKRCAASPAKSNETEPEFSKRRRRESPHATKTGDAARLEKVRALADELERGAAAEPQSAKKEEADTGKQDESVSESSVSSRTR